MEKIENIYESYAEASKNKDYVFGREKSKAESVMSSCFYALAMHSEYDIDFDLGEVIKILISRSLDPEILLTLNKKDEYLALQNYFDLEAEAEYNPDKKDKYLSLLKDINIRVANLCEKESQKMDDKKYELTEFNNIFKSYDKLRKHTRVGHVSWGITKERVESVSEHIYGCLVLAILMDSQSNIDFDLNHVLEMLLIHETEEVYCGDYSVFDPIDGIELDNSVESVLGKSKKKSVYLDLLDEYKSKKSNDSKIAFKIDKIEYDLQVEINDELGLYDLENLPGDDCSLFGQVQEMVLGGAKDVFDVHYLFDRGIIFKEDDDFALLLDYARQRK